MSSAITSLNGLSAAAQTFTTGTIGTDFNIVSSGSAHTFNIPDASATARGLVTTGAQTIAGSKIFSSAPLFSSLTAGSVPFIGTGGLLSENNAKLFWDASNVRLGIGTNTPGSDLTLVQNAGTTTSRGFRFTGNSIGGTSTGTGFSMALGYNVLNNKQLWLGDADYLGNAAGIFIRYSTSNGYTILDAIDGANGSRKPIALGVGNDANSTIILGSDLITTTPSSYVWANGNMAVGKGYRANAAPSNGLLVQGNVGIGTTAPATALHVSAAANPLTLSGVALGTNTTTDSLLTITSGLVRKLPLSTFASASNAWSTTGNAGTNYTTNFLGTTDNTSLRFRTNNTQGIILDSLGNVGIGSSPIFTASPNREELLVDAGTTSSVNAIVGRGSIDSYLQLNIQNQSSGTSSSSDVVATANNGSETNNYVDMGVNGGNYSGGVMGNANDAYLYNQGQNMLVGTGTTGKSLIFMTGGTSQSANERMRIDGTGNVGIGVIAPTQKLDVSGNINALNSIYLDAGGTNAGTRTTPALFFGGSGSGELIGSKRTTGGNQFGLDLYTASNIRMSVTRNGDVGIGTTTPASKIDVNGSVSLPIVPTTTDLTLNASHYTVIVTGSTPVITLLRLPAALDAYM